MKSVGWHDQMLVPAHAAHGAVAILGGRPPLDTGLEANRAAMTAALSFSFPIHCY